MLLTQALPQTDNNIVIHEVSSNIKENNTAERTFAVFGKVDDEFVLIFVFYVTEYFVDGIVHLELVDSLQYYNELNRTELYHTILLSYFCSCSLRGLKWIYFQSCPPGDDAYVFHDKASSQKQLSKNRLLSWYHKMIIKGVNGGVFNGGCDMSECRMDEIPHFLVSGEERDNEMIDRTTYFRVSLCSCQQQQSHSYETKSEHFDSIFYCNQEFMATCRSYNLSFATLESAKAATRWIITCLEQGFIPSQ